MKKILVGFFIALSVFAHAAKDLAKLNTLKFDAEERQSINGKEKLLKYKVTIEFPNKIKKEMTFPEMNKGEIYVYDGEIKQIYLPIFDEYKETKVENEENTIIQTINKIRNLKDTSKIKQEYQNKKLKTLYIDEKKKELINIKEYMDVSEYIFPKSIEVKEGDIKLGTILIDNVEINPSLEKEEFKINKGKK
ncbi:hypothetical protein [Fusobacterium sp.]|uniref:LolA family protein n=1 Tax=Fusobacterium sp. TaxID=68766 RepID=UPI0025BE5F27|nr:hypothetical protein [Fusobacterium sp.]MCI7223262.1 hypothetical protein [Fusobacterium sp.]